MSCNKIENHEEDGLDLLISQYTGRIRIENWLRANLKSIQELEDSTYQICNSFFIDTAVGDQLDAIAAIVGEKRGSYSDEELRIIISLKILANKSNGKVEDFLALLAAIDPNAVYTEKYPASIHLKLSYEITNLRLRSIIARFMKAIKPAGVALSAIARDNTTSFRMSPLYGASSQTGRGFSSVHGTVPIGAGKLVSEIITT